MFSLSLFFGRNENVKDMLSTLGGLIFLVSSVGIFFVGFFPLPYFIPHGISAFVAFVGIAVVLNIFGWKSSIYPALARLLGAISIAGIVWFAVVNFVSNVNYGLAAPEMVIIFPVIAWVIPVSIIMIKGKLGTTN